MIVPAASHLPLKVTANTGNVALRVPAAEIPLAVVRAAKDSHHCHLSEPKRRGGSVPRQSRFREQLQIASRSSWMEAPRRDRPCPRSCSFNQDDSWEILREGAIPAKEIIEALS